jgi:hypothetical protein
MNTSFIDMDHPRLCGRVPQELKAYGAHIS